MALDNKLKSDMAGSINKPAGINTASSIPERPSMTTSFESIDEIKTSTKTVPQPIGLGSPSDSTEELLKSIDMKLRKLNQSVDELKQEVSSCKNPDYRVVFSKIDSARSSIEKALAGAALSNLVDKTFAEKIAELDSAVNAVAEKQDRNDRQLAQTLRENANFQIQVRQGMQRDIDELKAQQNGEQFNLILKDLATIYVDYQSLLEDKTISGLSRKNLKALFEQIEDLLSEYGAEIIRSEVGDTRQTKSTKIIEKVPTGDQGKHNTIATSRQPGVMRGRTVLYPEFVDVFVYDPTIVLEEKNEIAASFSVEGIKKNHPEAKGKEMPNAESTADNVIADTAEVTEDADEKSTEKEKLQNMQIE